MNQELRCALEPFTGELAAGSVHVGGGSIAHCYRLRAVSGQRYFLKTLPAAEAGLLQAEADGLCALAAASAVSVPATLASGVISDCAYLLLEFLQLEPGSPLAAARLGRKLAQLHRHSQPQFGWHRDNYIGRSPQPNQPGDSWPEFFREQRLGFQLRLAATHGYGGRLQQRGGQLLEQLPRFFGAAPPPSLLHGDLWAGNWGAKADQCPVIFDPAVYYGDREADIAMTRLFGGFPPEFYAAYQEAWPLPDGFELRTDLYNLYHILNHLNLFGGAYAGQALDTIDRLLSQVG